MSDHRILDFTAPLQPDDITVGNVIVVHGEPRTIKEVRSISSLPHNESMVAELGKGVSQLFYVLTCHGCKTVRAFPGRQDLTQWYGVSHSNEYHVYCSKECLLKEVIA